MKVKVAVKFCTVGWCDNEYWARGMCHPHYDRWRRTGNPGGPMEPCFKPRRRGCNVQGCERKHYGNGLCAMHYARVWRSGKTGGRERLNVHVVRHGTLNEYNNFGCRCDECRAANTENMREYRRRKATA